MQLARDPSAAGDAEVAVEAGAEKAAALTVAARVEYSQPRAEAMQVAVARWDFAESMAGFATYDAGATAGLETRGYFGAVFDGCHVYFAPQCNRAGRHGLALRYDARRPFAAPGSWEGRDAGGTAGLETRGYYGAVADGRFVYYVPRTDGTTHHSRVLRYDTAGGFAEEGSWTARDAGVPVSYQGGAFDGRYVYFAPGYHQQTGPSGLVMRYDTGAAFAASASYSFFDAAAALGPACACFDGALYDGRHVYFAPLERGVALRCDTGGDFGNPHSWEAHDIGQVGGLRGGQCVGAVFDGRYVYFVPYGHSVALRYDTEGGFDDEASWAAFDGAGTSGLACCGYDGGAFDGRYVYFIPFWDGARSGRGFHAHLLRHDTRGPFADPHAWRAADGCALAPPNPGGFNGGAFDGRFLYMAPWRRDAATADICAHGQVLRYDTATAGASFALKLMDCGHNGGLGGAVPGPSFTVNTAAGSRTARAHRTPAGGRHQLAGTYDGRVVRLLVDGEVWGEQEGAGGLVTGDLPLAVGSFAGGTARLRGTLASVRVWGRALTGAEIAAW